MSIQNLLAKYKKKNENVFITVNLAKVKHHSAEIMSTHLSLGNELRSTKELFFTNVCY